MSKSATSAQDKPFRVVLATRNVNKVKEILAIFTDTPIPPLRFRLFGPYAGFVLDGGKFKSIFYRVEQSRGYESRGAVWSPGYLRTTLRPGALALREVRKRLARSRAGLRPRTHSAPATTLRRLPRW